MYLISLQKAFNVVRLQTFILILYNVQSSDITPGEKLFQPINIRWIRTGLGQPEKSHISSYYRQVSTNIEIINDKINASLLAEAFI